DKNEGVRRKAAYALGRIADKAGDVIPVLIKALKDKEPDVRQAAGDALAQFGEKSVAPLTEALRDDAVEIRQHAARSLAPIGHEAKAASPALAKLLNDKDNAALVNEAATALAKIGKSSIPTLTKAIKSENATVRQAAVTGLGQIGADAVPDLVDALSDKNVDVRRHTAGV